MKKLSSIAALLCLSVLILCCSKSGEKKDGEKVLESKLPTISLLDSASFNFGTINAGDVVEHTFRFKNGGAYPLIINNISSSCGCTTPEWPREPINSGDTSSVRVRFDSKHKSGPQVKTITVYANTEPSASEMRLTGIVNSVTLPDSTK